MSSPRTTIAIKEYDLGFWIAYFQEFHIGEKTITLGIRYSGSTFNINKSEVFTVAITQLRRQLGKWYRWMGWHWF